MATPLHHNLQLYEDTPRIGRTLFWVTTPLRHTPICVWGRSGGLGGRNSGLTSRQLTSQLFIYLTSHGTRTSILRMFSPWYSPTETRRSSLMKIFLYCPFKNLPKIHLPPEAELYSFHSPKFAYCPGVENGLAIGHASDQSPTNSSTPGKYSLEKVWGGRREDVLWDVTWTRKVPAFLD